MTTTGRSPPFGPGFMPAPPDTLTLIFDGFGANRKPVVKTTEAREPRTARTARRLVISHSSS
jgi:hypothetical protein